MTCMHKLQVCHSYKYHRSDSITGFVYFPNLTDKNHIFVVVNVKHIINSY